MTTNLPNSLTRNDFSTESTDRELDDTRSGGLDVFFHNCIYKMYDSSADENPFSKFAWQVYLPSMPPDTYENDWIDWIASLNDAAKDLPSAELRQLHQDLLFVSHARNLNVVEHDKERPELFIHDRQIQGLTMDWKRARQLYRKMQEE